MSITSTVDTRQFERAMHELRRATGATDETIIKNTTKGVLINLVRFTFIFKRIRNKEFKWLEDYVKRKAKGRARLGWWPAWKALQMKGAPIVLGGPLIDRNEGGIVDNSKKIGNPHITVFNEVPYIKESGSVVDRAIARQATFLMKSIEKSYTRILRGKSG